MTEPLGNRFTKKERSWILYDWANSVYATNIMAAIFPTLFVAFAGEGGDRWWGYGTSIATFVIALAAPFLGSIADFRGMKKRLFTIFMALGIVATAAIALTGDWRIMLIGYVVSKIGFSGSNLFYDSFLTDVTTNERMDKVSSWGFAMGYIGGSTIPFVLSIAMLLWLGYDSPVAQKFSILITSAWWLVFSIPFLKNVRQEYFIQRPKRLTLGAILGNTLATARDILSRRALMLFILSYFFYIDGVNTVISIATAYGTALGLGATGMILALLVTQVVAMPSSILFGRLAKRVTARKAILLAIAVYTVICCVGFYMGYSLEPHQDAYDAAFRNRQAGFEQTYADIVFENAAARETLDAYVEDAGEAVRTGEFAAGAEPELDTSDLSTADAAAVAQARALIDAGMAEFITQDAGIIASTRDALAFSTILFWTMSVLVGTMQGGIQAVSRSYFGKLVPKERSNEYFGFFDIFGKFAAVIGPALYALAGTVTGRSSFGALSIAGLFVIGFIILLAAKKPLEEMEAGTAGTGIGKEI